MPIENQITVIEARNYLADKKRNFFLIDVSDGEEEEPFLETFTKISLQDLGKQIPTMQRELITLIICEDGEKSIKAQQLLQACGQKAYAIRGGVKDWKQVILED